MDKYILIPLLPLTAFIINILFGKSVTKDKAHWVAILAVLGSFVLALHTFTEVLGGKTVNQDVYTWFVSGSFRVSMGFLIDQLTAIMLIVVTSISLLVHIYSVGYMHGDGGYYRFFSYLSLFTFSMLMLVMGNNLLQLYFGWEAVGLCSYFLIGFWYEKKSAADAGKKAFIVNRFGDFGFGLGVIMIFLTLGSVYYADIFSKIGTLQGQTINLLGYDVNLITLIALLLFCGAVGKSAQIPLHVWLPDAMEGPTPVSALIHAATMVTAGVFMVARFNPVFSLSEVAMNVVAVTGAVTSLFAATIALVQNDIKRIIAYSTVSQLGYMFLACGVGAYGAGVFHLYTHAYFKALLFLGAGSVMHAMSGELDIQKMGGLKKYMPVTYWTFLIASLSIAGIPGLAGFFSKDEILWLAYNGGPVGKVVWAIGTLVAALTAFYSFRIIFLAFHGKFRGTREQEHHLHESPKSMTIPLIILAVGAIAAGWVGIPSVVGGSNAIARFFQPVLGHPHVHAGHDEEWIVMGISVAVAMGGIFVSWVFYSLKPGIPRSLAANFKGIYTTLWNKYYIDELYDFIIIRPVKWTAVNVLMAVTDGAIIEGIVNGIPKAIANLSARLRKLQTGYVQHYAMSMAIGLFVIITLFLIAASK
ncbi:MAG: NADH-quinone oxidoreductase subunit L [Nitrospirae bacterium]|nr:NADH-quinone oxidoreductase subunit L [Nitrospirota bacterium]MCL5238039.1 NADH-quinone oxidoreductase subunit L [Nitrospirota bacterium]